MTHFSASDRNMLHLSFTLHAQKNILMSLSSSISQSIKASQSSIMTYCSGIEGH